MVEITIEYTLKIVVVKISRKRDYKVTALELF
jgi:hypothetical protein